MKEGFKCRVVSNIETSNMPHVGFYTVSSTKISLPFVGKTRTFFRFEFLSGGAAVIKGHWVSAQTRRQSISMTTRRGPWRTTGTLNGSFQAWTALLKLQFVDFEQRKTDTVSCRWMSRGGVAAKKIFRVVEKAKFSPRRILRFRWVVGLDQPATSIYLHALVVTALD
jgi:hypothetical protein